MVLLFEWLFYIYLQEVPLKTLTKNIIGNRRLTEKLPENVLLYNAEIFGHKDKTAILLKNGIVEKIEKTAPKNFDGEKIDLAGKTIIPGGVDLHSIFREPGREDVETLKTGSLAAARGGFTQICMMPSTNPPVDSQEKVEYIKDKTENYLVKINVIGALTKNCEGKSIAPFAELAEEGAVAFSDYDKHIKSPSLMRTALSYLKMLERPVVVKPADSDLNELGQMHEGYESMRLGFYGMPSIAEEIVVSRDLQIAKYENARIHFTNISTKGSVERIRLAKSKGVNVTCDVAVHNLIQNDTIMETFDTNLKLNPPLRSQDHIDALIEGLKDGTIDAISSAHSPHSWEEKEAEFIYAPYGAVSLETMVPLLLDKFVHTNIFSLEDIVKFVATNPAKIFNLENTWIEEGKNAALAILDLHQEYKIDINNFASKSQNSPYNGWKVKGKIFGTISNNKKYFL
jgi:dihydroorotase